MLAFILFQLLEEFTDNTQTLLIQFDQLMGPLRRKDVAGDINNAKTMLSYHSQLKDSINSPAVDTLGQDARNIMKRLDHARGLNNGSAGRSYPLNLQDLC